MFANSSIQYLKMNFRVTLKLLILVKMISTTNQTAKLICEKTESCTIENLTPDSSLSEKVYKKSYLGWIKKLNFRNSQFPEVPELVTNKITNLVTLDLSGVGLEFIRRRHLENFKNLVTFIASDNKLKFIPMNLFVNNTNIRYIDLSNNRIKILKALSIRNLGDLEVVDLRGNICIDKKFENVGNLEDRYEKFESIKCKAKDTNINTSLNETETSAEAIKGPLEPTTAAPTGPVNYRPRI